ncbi:MAG: SWIM zinc finger family protein [Prevotellaceae bacterium]|jgi:hypothetical protein|nr:SWIM zinc finger family protein [Prevotellaceae bacterium]
MNNIIDLQEISRNCWRAKYQGNYGTYTIKMTLDRNGKAFNYSCSCPSDYYPCKHIAMIQEAIIERIAKNQRLSEDTGGKTQTTKELLNEISAQELRDFVERQARYNHYLDNAIRLEFAHKLTGKLSGKSDENGENPNPYFAILRESLEEASLDIELNYGEDGDYYDYDALFDLETVDQWLEKARDYVKDENYTEAILICKACIEEFARWSKYTDSEIVEYIDSYSYENIPFEIMGQIAASPDTDAKQLYDYCLSEMNKDVYSESAFNRFNDLLMTLAVRVNSSEFIALQNNLLKKIPDKSSIEAEKILRREIFFYNNTQQSEKANALIEQNIQIENFRYKVAETRFAEQKYAEARKLIDDFLPGQNHAQRWDELLLQVAQKENDIPTIRSTAFSFISRSHNQKYFSIYKATFTPDEWQSAFEDLLLHYDKNSGNYGATKKRYFSGAIADALLAEGATDRLMQYIETNLTAERIEKYHPALAASYPEKTLELFRKVIDEYATNTGRSNYEYVLKMLKLMKKIDKGDRTVSEMVSRYRIEYKNRRLMLEILRNL